MADYDWFDTLPTEAQEYIRRLETNATSEMGRRIVALRKQVEHTCEVCYRGFTGYSHARYCSAACRQAAFRRRHKKTEESG